MLLVLMFFSDRFYVAPCSHVYSDRFLPCSLVSSFAVLGFTLLFVLMFQS